MSNSSNLCCACGSGAFLGPNQGCRLFVRNVPDTCDERRLKQEFEGFGTVREAAIVRNRDGSSKGYGFVVYEDPEALMKAASQAQRVIDGELFVFIFLGLEPVVQLLLVPTSLYLSQLAACLS